MIVKKCDQFGNEVWRYEGKIIQQRPHCVTLEARFNRPDLPFHGIVLGNQDRFIETFFTHKWYNIFEIHDRDDDHLKGWYCNISYPAEIKPDQVVYRDLALDLLVYPNGKQLVLDEDEFDLLDLTLSDRMAAKNALIELQQIFSTKPSNFTLCL